MLALLPWLLASMSAILLVAATACLARPRQRNQQPPPLPTEWALTARPVFNTDERRVYRQLREALPHHIVLSKLPLVRFCQPSDPQRSALLVRAAGLDPRHVCHLQRQRARAGSDRPRHRPRQLAPRAADQAVRARRLPGSLPALPGRPPALDPELQLLVPQASAASRGPQPAPSRPQQPAAMARATRPRSRRRERATLWQDSSFFQDSFFGADTRLDVSAPGDLGGYDTRQPRLPVPEVREGVDGALPGGDAQRYQGTGTHN
jgi:hypothetical protein